MCDGAVAVFDAMQGVETQSETVWMQANKFNIPRIGFINKLDRTGSDIETTIESVKRRLKVEPLLINVPCDDTNQLNGLIDLPSMMHFEYKDEMGQYVDMEPIDQSHKLFDRAIHFREKLVEQLSNFDDELADSYLSGTEPFQIHEELINHAIKKSITGQHAVALFCGSALKNKGVQPLLDGVIKYLPSPSASTSKVLADFKIKPKELCALAFKVVNDKEKGLITFFRVYSGVLQNRQKIMNANLGQVERVLSLMRVRANEMQVLEEIKEGDIGAIIGCKHIRSGDTLINETGDAIKLSGVDMPPPVFFCSIEADMSRDKQELE